MWWFLLLLGALCSCNRETLADAPSREAGGPRAPVDAGLERGSVDDVEPIERQLLELLNARRARAQRCGARPMARVAALVLERRLQRAARSYVLELFETRSFSHRGRGGTTPAQRATSFGVSGFVGEALANNTLDAAEAVESLFASESHCRLLMAKEASLVGIAFLERVSARYESYLAIELASR